MKNEFEKLVIHISAEMEQRLKDASEKLKLSRGSIIRQALDEFLVNKGVEKNKKA
jgi:predicted DNA-binding protein